MVLRTYMFWLFRVFHSTTVFRKLFYVGKKFLEKENPKYFSWSADFEPWDILRHIIETYNLYDIKSTQQIYFKHFDRKIILKFVWSWAWILDSVKIVWTIFWPSDITGISNYQKTTSFFHYIDESTLFFSLLFAKILFLLANKNRMRTKNISNTKNEIRTRTKKYACSFIPARELRKYGVPLHVEEMTCPFRIVIWDEPMKLSRQTGSLPSIQKLCKLLLKPTRSWLPLIDRLVIQTPLSLVLCNWNSSLATSTSSLFKQCSNFLKPGGIAAIVSPLCLIIISLPSQYIGPEPSECVGCWHSDSSLLDVAPMQNFSVLSFPWKKV